MRLGLALSSSLPAVEGGAPAAARALLAGSSSSSSSTCDVIPLPAASTGSWAFPSHRLSTLGGASVLDVDTTTSEFRVWACDGAVPPPPPESGASGTSAKKDAGASSAASASSVVGRASSLPCVAVDHGAWPPLAAHSQAVWLGSSLGDALLLFDPLSGGYEGWPLRRQNGRTMPRPGQQPLAVGHGPSSPAASSCTRAARRSRDPLRHVSAAAARFDRLYSREARLGRRRRRSHTASSRRNSRRQPSPALPIWVSASPEEGEARPSRRAGGGPFLGLAATPLGQPCPSPTTRRRTSGTTCYSPSSKLGRLLRAPLARGPDLPPLQHVGGGNLQRSPCRTSRARRAERGAAGARAAACRETRWGRAAATAQTIGRMDTARSSRALTIPRATTAWRATSAAGVGRRKRAWPARTRSRCSFSARQAIATTRAPRASSTQLYWIDRNTYEAEPRRVTLPYTTM